MHYEAASATTSSTARRPTPTTDDPDTAREETSLTTFTTNGYVIVGAGETIDEVQVNGRWLKTDSPVEVRR